MDIAFQIIALVFTLLAYIQKKKWLVLLFSVLASFSFAGMFFYFGRNAGACISLVSAVRSLVYMIFALKNLKPNLYVMLAFEAGFIVATALTWNDALDLLPLFAIVTESFTSWQENKWIFRMGYIICPALFLVYKAIICAYISMAGEVLALAIAIFAFFYYCVFKNEVSVLNRINFFKKRKKQNSSGESLDKNEDEIA